MADAEDPWMFDEDSSGFNPTEFEDPAADMEAAAADAVVREMTAPRVRVAPPKAEDYKLSGDLGYMDDVVRRMDVAMRYRDILGTPLFDDEDDNTSQVESEIREFCLQRLQVLVGMKADNRPVSSARPLPFDDAQINALKGLAALVPALQALLNSLGPTEQAVLKTLVAATLKHQGKAAPKAAPTPPARIPSKTPTPVPAPSPPVAKPVFTPAPVVKPAAPRPKARVQSSKTPAAAIPVPVPVAKVGPPIAGTVTRQIESESTGQMVNIEIPITKRQRPSGMVPFPDARSMEMATAVLAGMQSSALLANSEVENKHHNL